MIQIIIPVHNRREITLDCLRDLAAQEEVEFLTTIVDDGSSDGTSQAIRDEFPDVALLPGDGNLWWGGAVNLGISECLKRRKRPEFIVLLNDDIRIGPLFLKGLLACARKNPHALIGSLVVKEGARSQVLWCGAAASPSECAEGIVSRDSLTGTVPAKTLPGRGLIIPVEVFDQIGLYDSDTFPHYYSDVDFSLRAAAGGWTLLCCCDTEITLLAEQTAVGSPHRRVPWRAFVRSFTNDRSPNHLPTMWSYYRRHSSRAQFVVQVGRILLGDLRRRIRGSR